MPTDVISPDGERERRRGRERERTEGKRNNGNNWWIGKEDGCNRNGVCNDAVIRLSILDWNCSWITYEEIFSSFRHVLFSSSKVLFLGWLKWGMLCITDAEFILRSAYAKSIDDELRLIIGKGQLIQRRWLAHRPVSKSLNYNRNKNCYYFVRSG